MSSDWARLSRAARDRAYNNPEAVAEFPQIMARLESGSAAYRAAHPAKLGIPYGVRARNAWDLFPAADAAAPCLVFIHGGYWQRGGRELYSVLCEGIRAHGWSAALPGYTLAPEATLAEIVAEIHAGLGWLADSGPAHGIAGRIVVSGNSAGGHLTAMALSHPAVTAALAISGVFELGPIRDTYLNEKLQLSDTEVETLSPLRLPVVMKPMSIAYGTAELPALMEDSRALHARRAAAHAPGALLPVSGANHFDILDQLQAKDGLITRQILDLLP